MCGYFKLLALNFPYNIATCNLISLFLFNWEQTIRIKENIFNLSKKDRKAMVENIIIIQK